MINPVILYCRFFNHCIPMSYTFPQVLNHHTCGFIMMQEANPTPPSDKFPHFWRFEYEPSNPPHSIKQVDRVETQIRQPTHLIENPETATLASGHTLNEEWPSLHPTLYPYPTTRLLPSRFQINSS